jgi:hypothetical protein
VMTVLSRRSGLLSSGRPSLTLVSGKVAWQRLGRPLCLARLLGRDLVIRAASQGYSAGTWSPAPPRKIARQGLGRPLRLVRLLDESFLGFVWAPHSCVPNIIDPMISMFLKY